MAGTVVETITLEQSPFHRITFTCTADASDGSFPATDVLHKFSGKVLQFKTNPGATAPTANYDITLVDADGLDVLQGLGANRHTSNSEVVNVVYSSTSVHPVVDVDDTLTLTITNNSVNSAIVVAHLYIYTGTVTF